MAAPAVVRFKFRSSSTFDTIEIGNRSSISISDLKSEIIKKKHLNLSHDFDLQFSDSVSGLEYKNENAEIPSGSSVIIKRVPATSTPLPRHDDVSNKCFREEKGNPKITLEGDALNDAASALDDFGFDLYSLADTSDHDLGELQSDAVEKKGQMVPRCSEGLLVRCHKLDETIVGQATPKGSSANEGSTLVMQSKPKADEQVHLERVPGINLVMERSDMPSELKCSLCRNFFEEAVMIPCCQHSFCEKCIRVALSKNSKCPMCSSYKCKAEDLLPNVSLRQAIERFLESQLLRNGSENNLHRYAPDGESGIQVKELSFVASVMPRQSRLKVSNQIMQNKLRSPANMHCDPNTLEGFSEFEGENDLQNAVRFDEEASCNQRGDVHHVAGGEARTSTAPFRLKRGPRTCYTCGSPDHLMRECPMASISHSNHWKGDATFMGSIPACPTPYWAGTPPLARPYVDMYGGPGMMMYNAAVPSIPPFAYPACASSMYPAYPAPSGHMKLGMVGTGPPARNNCPQPSHADFFGSPGVHGGNHSGYMGRDDICRPVSESTTRHDDRGTGVNFYDENFARRSEGKYRSHNHSDANSYLYDERQEKMFNRVGGRDFKVSQSDRSTSEKAISVGRICLMEDGHEKPYRRAQYGDDDDDSGRGDGLNRRREHNYRKSDREYQSHSRSGKEQSYSGDGRQRPEESSHRSQHLKKRTKSFDSEFHHDRAKTKHSNDDYAVHYHGHHYRAKTERSDDDYEVHYRGHHDRAKTKHSDDGYEVHYRGHHDRDKKNKHVDKHIDRESRERYRHHHHDREKTKRTDDDLGGYYHGSKRKKCH